VALVKLARAAPRPYRKPVLGDLAKRLVNGAVVCVAAMAFFLVPLGRKTLAEHLAGVLGTGPAREAAAACAGAGRRVVTRAADELKTLRQERHETRPPAPPPRDLEPAD
jgi:hypothetical protein